MTDNLILFSKFANSFNKNDETQTASLHDIQLLENTFGIKLPEDFKLFVINYGNLWTPDILDIIVDNDMDINDVQQIWTIDEIIEDKISGVSEQIKENLIPFASDCTGNIYAFKSSDIKKEKLMAKVYFFDLDLDKLYPVANSFTDLIEEFNSLI